MLDFPCISPQANSNKRNSINYLNNSNISSHIKATSEGDNTSTVEAIEFIQTIKR